MKIRTTFDVNDDQRIALGLAINGKMRMLSREELEHWLQVTIAGQLQRYDDALAEARDELLAKLKI